MQPQQESFRRHPLSRVLGSVAQVRVLRELCLHGGPLSVSQLVAPTSLTNPAVRQALNTLVSLGVLRGLGKRNSQLFELSADFSLLTPIRELFMREHAAWENTLNELRAGFAALPAVRAVWLYGSLARGEDGPASDADFAVLAASDDDKTMASAREGVSEVAERLQLRPSSIVMSPRELGRNGVDLLWFESVIRDAKTLKGKDPAAEKQRCERERERKSK